MFAGKLLRAGSDEVNVGAFIEHQPGRLDGVTEPFHAGHAARAQRASVHQQRIELYPSIPGKKAAAARIEGLIVFKNRDRRFDRVDCRPALLKQCVSGPQSIRYASLVGLQHVFGNGPGTAVNEKNGRDWHREIAYSVYSFGV